MREILLIAAIVGIVLTVLDFWVNNPETDVPPDNCRFVPRDRQFYVDLGQIEPEEDVKEDE